MTEQTAWLIERADPVYPGNVLPNSFLGIAGSYDGMYGSGRLQWLTNPTDALLFARQKDAAMFVGMMGILQEDMIFRDTVPGLRSGEPRAIVVEHSWSEL